MLDAVRSWDRHAGNTREPVSRDALVQAGVQVVILHVRDLGRRNAQGLQQTLVEQGAALRHASDDLIVIAL